LCKRVERKKELQWQQPIAAAARAAMRVDELSRVDVILLLYMYLL
jgi:hypothetical protein